MKYAKLFLLLLLAVAAAATGAFGQENPPPEDGRHEDRTDARRPNLLAELGLSREQLQQIRRINQEHRPAMLRAQRRLREANGALDMAIYADTVSDTDFQTRLGEFRSAQSELARLRFESELSVRRILTAEQLIRFRDLRQKFAEAREAERPNRRFRRGGGGGDRPTEFPPPERPTNP